MTNSEVLIHHIKSTNPEADRSPILSFECGPQQFPTISARVEQSVQFALANITHNIIWSQRHLVEEEKFRTYQNKRLNRVAQNFPPCSIFDAIEAIDENLKGILTNNTHLREARLAFNKGVETANNALRLEDLKTSEILEDANLPDDKIREIDNQVTTLSGYYSAWEALNAKRTTAKDFGDNPFLAVIELFKYGARNINLETLNGITPIEADVFTRMGETIQLVNWIQTADKKT